LRSIAERAGGSVSARDDLAGCVVIEDAEDLHPIWRGGDQPVVESICHPRSSPVPTVATTT
jgi:hypothetical protein